MRDPLIIYSPDYDTTIIGYASNGLRVLYPTLCEHSLEFGQAGSIHVEMPLDDDGAWKSIQLHHIVRAPVEFRGLPHSQLFRIYRIKKSRSSGVPSIEFDARHVFYDLAYILLQDVRPTEKNCQDAIQWLFDNPYAPDGTSQMPLGRYSFSSDITGLSTAYYEWKTLCGALIGEDNCVLNRWGGELYVDNYYFSIKSRMENSMEDAFTIAYGLNLTDISETVDGTNIYSRVAGSDNAGHTATASVALTDVGLPFEKAIHASFSYSDEDATAERFAADFAAYAESLNELDASYTVKFADLAEDDPFMTLKYCEVGDTGVIMDDELGIQTTQRVMKTVTDLLTGERISTETGTVKRSIAKKAQWSDTVTVSQTAEQKQIAKLAEDVNDLDFAVTVHTPIATTSGKYITTSGGKFITYKEG